MAADEGHAAEDAFAAVVLSAVALPFTCWGLCGGRRVALALAAVAWVAVGWLGRTATAGASMVALPHEVLGVEEDADLRAARAAYRRKSLEVHPDKPGGDEATFRHLKTAYDAMSGVPDHTPPTFAFAVPLTAVFWLPLLGMVALCLVDLATPNPVDAARRAAETALLRDGVPDLGPSPSVADVQAAAAALLAKTRHYRDPAAAVDVYERLLVDRGAEGAQVALVVVQTLLRGLLGAQRLDPVLAAGRLRQRLGGQEQAGEGKSGLLVLDVDAAKHTVTLRTADTKDSCLVVLATGQQIVWWCMARGSIHTSYPASLDVTAAHAMSASCEAAWTPTSRGGDGGAAAPGPPRRRRRHKAPGGKGGE